MSYISTLSNVLRSIIVITIKTLFILITCFCYHVTYDYTTTAHNDNVFVHKII